MGRLRGYLWLMAGLVVAVLAGAVAFITLSRAAADRADTATAAVPTRNVVVAAHSIEIRAVLNAADVEVKEVPIDTIPEGALWEAAQVIGKISLVGLYPGEIILEQRLIDPNVTAPDGRLAVVIADDQVLMAFPADDLMSRVNILKPGDRVDFLFTLDLPVDRGTGFVTSPTTVTGPDGTTEEPATEQVTFNLLQAVTIAAIVGNQPPQQGQVPVPNALLLTISPQDALVLKYMKDAGAVVDLVLRAPGVEGTFSVEPVDLEFLINGYILPGDLRP